MSQNVSNPAYNDFKSKRLFSSLDGLRTISILAVIWHHSAYGYGSWNGANLGFLGVDLFFIISGFLIVTLLIREFDENSAISLKLFYTRRSLRIFPLYFSFILGLAAYYYLFNTNSEIGTQFIGELPFYLTYTANFVPVSFGIVWSLCAEEQFYLIWPFVEKMFRRYWMSILILLLVINQIVNFPSGKLIISQLVGSSEWTKLSIWQITFTPILLGVFAAHILHHPKSFIVTHVVLGRKVSVLFIFALLITLFSVSPPDISGLPRLLIHLTMLALVISCVIREDHLFAKGLKFAPMQRVGKISYGIYLFHLHVIVASSQLLGFVDLHNPIILFSLSTFIVIALAEISYRYFELPFLKLKKRYSVIKQTHA